MAGDYRYTWQMTATPSATQVYSIHCGYVEITEMPQFITSESLWKQHKLFGRIPSKWVTTARTLAWALMGANAVVSLIYMLWLDGDNPTNVIGLSLWLPFLLLGLAVYVWRVKERLGKVASVMNALERANGGN